MTVKADVVAPQVVIRDGSIQDRALQIATQQDVSDLTKEVIDLRVHPIEDPQQYLALDPYMDPNSGNVYNERVRHEMRMHHWFIPVANIAAAKIELFKLWGTVQYELEVFEERLAQEQPGCSWKLLAYDLRYNPGRMMTAPTASVGGFSRANINDALKSAIDIDDGKSKPVGLDRKMAFVPRADPTLEIDVLYVDVGRGLLRCPNIQHEPTWDSTMATYARERALRFMTEGMRAHRRKCEALFRKCFPPPSIPTHPQGKAARPAPVVAEGEAPRVEATDEELLPLIMELRSPGPGKAPMAPAHIAKKLKLPLDRVRGLIAAEAQRQAREASHVDGG